MFKLITSIKDLVTVLSIVATFGLSWYGLNQKEKADTATNNLYSKTTQWEDEKGHLVTEVTELRFKTKDLKSIIKRDSSQMNELEKQLYKAGKIVEQLKIKQRNTESVNIADLSVSNDSLVTTIHYDDNNRLKALKPIKTDHLLIDFKVADDSIIVNHKYHATINTVIHRKVDKLTKRNNRRFFIARWINPRWEYSAINVTDDKNAIFKSAIHINFKKKR